MPVTANMLDDNSIALEENADSDHVFLNELFKPIRDLAKNFDIDLSLILSRYSEEILHTRINGHNRDWHPINFAEAALVIQGSASIYGKKVEFLYNIATQLLQFLHDEKKKSSGSDKRRDKDHLIAGQHNADDFVAHDDIKFQPDANKLNEDFETAHRRYRQTLLSRTPLALITLSEEEKGDTSLMTKTGEVFGNRNDYNMNICRRDEFDFLTLPTLSCIGLEDIFGEDASVSSLSSSHIGNLSCIGDFVGPDELSNVNFHPPNDNLPPEIDIPSPTKSTSSKSTRNASVAGVVDDQDDDCAIHEDPICDDGPENSPTPVVEANNAEPLNGSRRRSARQAEKEEKVAAAAKAEELRKMWSTEEAPEKDVVLPIQKSEKRTKRTRRRKGSARDSKYTTEIINEAMNKGRKGPDLQKVTLDSKTLKKMPPAKDISVNEAFELLFTNNYQDEKEVADQLRRQLQRNCEASSPDDGFGEIDDHGAGPDDDNDGGPDIDGGDVGDMSLPLADDCLSPDSGLYQASLNQPLHSPTPENLSFEGILRAHVASYMKEADKYVENTELSERVKLWEEKIKPVLELESQRETFDIHLYGSRIIDNFENNNRKQTVPFAKVVTGKTSWEVCRYFLATLVLANNNNVEISSTSLSTGMHDVNLTLLTRKRHQERLDAFGHGSGEHC